jgi:3-oxoacyl-[acyl-carrier protein] reductase
MDLGLKGKVVFITGASKGIGKACAFAFAKEGALLALVARNPGELEQAAQAIRREGGEALAIAADVTKTGDVERAIAETVARFGSVHVLVNNAGGSGGFPSFEEIQEQQWIEAMDVHVFAAVRTVRTVVPYMRRQRWGRIINISSESAVQPDAEMTHYNASKGALNTLTKSLSKIYAKDGILVNTVSPGFTMTGQAEDFFRANAKANGTSFDEEVNKFLQWHRPQMPLARPATPEEVAAPIVFLASEQASFINGANLRVDGGSVCSV